MSTHTITFTLRICSHPTDGYLYALIVDQDGDVTDLAGPFSMDDLPMLRSGDHNWNGNDRDLDWAQTQPWKLVEDIPLNDEEA